MLDPLIKPRIDPWLDRLGHRIAARGIGADTVTLVGLALGLAAALAVTLCAFACALLLVLLSRLADGLDGAVARATRPSDFGGFLDIIADFLFYAAIPLAFVLSDPAGNGAAGALLLAAFYVNGATFLGYAVLAERAGLSTEARGRKTLYFSGGLLEGTETIAFFVLICLFPAAFPWLATGFALLCLVTAASRVAAAWLTFGGGQRG
ncbi:CDP-alcohol phosphatidyltransferase family protein [soil metagenome]